MTNNAGDTLGLTDYKDTAFPDAVNLCVKEYDSIVTLWILSHLTKISRDFVDKDSTFIIPSIYFEVGERVRRSWPKLARTDAIICHHGRGRLLCNTVSQAGSIDRPMKILIVFHRLAVTNMPAYRARTVSKSLLNSANCLLLI